MCCIRVIAQSGTQLNGRLSRLGRASPDLPCRQPSRQRKQEAGNPIKGCVTLLFQTMSRFPAHSESHSLTVSVIDWIRNIKLCTSNACITFSSVFFSIDQLVFLFLTGSRISGKLATDPLVQEHAQKPRPPMSHDP